MSQTAMRFRDENRRPTGCRGLAPRSPFLRIASRALQSAGRGRFASALPAEYHSRLGAIILRYEITRLSHPTAQLDAAADHFEVLERLELGVAGRQPAAKSAAR